MLLRKTFHAFMMLIAMASALFGVVDHSIIPSMDRYTQVENLPTRKYSASQLAEITAALTRSDERIRLASYNVLFNLYDHNLDEANRWPQRLPRIVELIEEMQPDIIGVQELYPSQLQDLLPHLQETYAFYSRASDHSELNGIFYRKERFDVIDSEIWFMTDSPQLPSNATLTMLKLKDRTSGKLFAVFNTHLAFSNIEKRDFQARFIANHIQAFDGLPIILTGDLNTFPHRPDLEQLPFYDGDYVHRILTRDRLKDAKDVSVLGHLGPLSTFSNHPPGVEPFKGTGTAGVFLDHIYVSDGIQVLIHAVQPATVEGHYPSDHLPILIDFVVESL